MPIGDDLTEVATPETPWRRYLDGMLRHKGLHIDMIGSRKSHHEGV